MTTKQKNGLLTPEEMREALAADKAAREQLCLEAVNAVLKQFDCQLVVIPQLTPDGRITAGATIKAT
jgi:hypothetical protein